MRSSEQLVSTHKQTRRRFAQISRFLVAAIASYKRQRDHDVRKHSSSSGESGRQQTSLRITLGIRRAYPILSFPHAGEKDKQSLPSLGQSLDA